MRSIGRIVRAAGTSKCQGGLTLVELLVALTIIAMLGATVVTTTYQLLKLSAQSNEEQLAVSQVRAAEHWITRDVLTSQGEIVDDEINPSGFPLVLSWTAFDGTAHTVTYSLLDSSPSPLKRLQRQDVTASGTATAILADYIDEALTSCSFDDERTLTVTIAATAESYTATRTFEAQQRSDPES